MPADPRVEAITAQVRADLIDQMRDLQQNANRYINEYVAAFLGPKTTWRPRPSFHPKLAELIRELAQDAALADRTCGAAVTSINRGDGSEVPSQSSREVAA